LSRDFFEFQVTGPENVQGDQFADEFPICPELLRDERISFAGVQVDDLVCEHVSPRIEREFHILDRRFFYQLPPIWALPVNQPTILNEKCCVEESVMNG